MTKIPQNLNEINVKADYEKDVLAIWEKFKEHDIFKKPEFKYRKYPILPEIVDKNSLLFIGINPSFRKGSIIKESEKPIAFYPKKLNRKIKDIPYFEKMKNVAEYCETDWTHLDLFFIRETKQELIENLSYNSIEFINAQLKISFEIIKRANPRLIIVSNALASEFFGKKKETKHLNLDKIWKGTDLYFEKNIWNKEPTFNSEIGTYQIELNNNLVPIIFSGMLSGQRALDIGSLERLKWQAKMILDGKLMK
jgi:hypothetical protein